jgi:hypothetical protein
MYKFVLFFFLSLSLAHGADQGKKKNSIKEIRLWLEVSDSTQTCVDEYFKRRKELAIKIGFAPVIIAGSTVVGGYGGALAGAGVFELSGIPYGGLGNVVALAIGGVVGSTFGLTLGATEEVVSLVNFFKTEALMRFIFESQTTKGLMAKKFYDEFMLLYPYSSLDEDKFMEEVSYLDTLGVLCDGSLVKAKRYKKGQKLKQNLATKKEIFDYLSAIH